MAGTYAKYSGLGPGGGGGGGSTDSFVIMQPPNGTAPTASSSTDTLTFTSSDSSVTITGNATTKTLDFTASGGGPVEFDLGNVTGSIAIDWADGNSQHGIMSTDTTITALNNGVAGSTYILKFTQPFDSNATITWPAITWLNSTNVPPPMTAPSGVLVVQIFFDGTDYSAEYNYTQWDPQMLSGIVLDLDLSDTDYVATSGANARVIYDKSSNMYNFTPVDNTAFGQIIPRAINGLQTLQMTPGTNDYTINTSATNVIDQSLPFDLFFIGNPVGLSGRQYAHAFVLGGGATSDDVLHLVYSSVQPAEQYAFFGSKTGNWGQYQVPGATLLATDWHMVELTYNGSGTGSASNFEFLVDNASQTITTSVDNWDNANNGSCLGAYTQSNAYSWTGFIARWIVFNRILTTNERTQMAAWRLWKYGF